jgi:hypothetical protein
VPDQVKLFHGNSHQTFKDSDFALRPKNIKNKGRYYMQRVNTRQIYALFLLSTALLQFALLVTSMITSFFSLVKYGIQPQWPSYLTALVPLGIAAAGTYQIRTQQEIIPLSQRVGIPCGLSLGIVSAILLSIPHNVGITLGWAAIGLPMLIGLLIQDPADISSISPMFALVSVSLYVVFAASYSICAFLVTRHDGSVKQGIWSSDLASMATYLGMTLTFVFIEIVTNFSQPANDRVPLVNHIAGYHGLVDSITMILLTPVILALLIALVSSYISRYITFRFTYMPNRPN